MISPGLASNLVTSLFLRPLVETISPLLRKALETLTAWSKRPPGLSRKSRTYPFNLS